MVGFQGESANCPVDPASTAEWRQGTDLVGKMIAKSNSAAQQLRPPQVGEPAPWFRVAALNGNPDFVFDTVAGRPILLLFFGSAAEPAVSEALLLLDRHRASFDDEKASFFGVSINPEDAAKGRIAVALPGIRYFLDYDGTVSRMFGAIEAGNGQIQYRPHWVVLDRQLRIVGKFDLVQGETAINCLKAIHTPTATQDWAPVLEVPNIFEPALCTDLVKYYDQGAQEESGFMREVDGKTVQVHDHGHKRRSDVGIDNAELVQLLQTRIYHRLKPMIKRAFQFDATRMERYIIACYESETSGHFRPHRDNTTSGTAHRRFAVTINLNAGEYEGGDLRFPEFGPRLYRAPTGGAIVFSCSLLHEVLPVTAGRRLAFLPFLYDEAASDIRRANNIHLADDVPKY